MRTLLLFFLLALMSTTDAQTSVPMSAICADISKIEKKLIADGFQKGLPPAARSLEDDSSVFYWRGEEDGYTIVQINKGVAQTIVWVLQ